MKRYSHFMQVENDYVDLLSDLLVSASWPEAHLEDRTGTGRVTNSGKQIRAYMDEGFPILESKRVWFKGTVVETLWMLNGRTDLDYLHEHKVHYWDSWALDDGTLGPTYGKQIRNHHGVDQWQACVDSIKNNPSSRRHIITTWSPSEVPEMGLPPCHGLVIQFIPKNDNKLDLVMYQRSSDIFLGLPFNLVNYGLMLHIMAMLTGREPNKMTIQFGDLHLYLNHVDAANQFLKQHYTRLDQSNDGLLPDTIPSLTIEKKDRVEDLTVDDFTLHDYSPSAHIPAPVAV